MVSSRSKVVDPTDVTTEITSGDALFTTSMKTADGQLIVEIVDPTPVTTTFGSGSVNYTTTLTTTDGEETIEVITATGDTSWAGVSSAPIVTPACERVDAIRYQRDTPIRYQLYYSGQYLIENTSNIVNKNFPPLYISFDGSLDMCDAALNCAYWVFEL